MHKEISLNTTNRISIATVILWRCKRKIGRFSHNGWGMGYFFGGIIDPAVSTVQVRFPTVFMKQNSRTSRGLSRTTSIIFKD